MTDDQTKPKLHLYTCDNCDNIYLLPITEKVPDCGRCNIRLMITGDNYTISVVALHNSICTGCGRLRKSSLVNEQECILCSNKTHVRIDNTRLP